VRGRPKHDRRRADRKVFVFRERRRPRWRRWFPFILSALIALVAPMIAYGQTAGDSLTLAWTDTGDDSTIGTATQTELRLFTAPITLSNWDVATMVPGAPTPGPSGTAETMIVRGLTNGVTYYFAVRLADEAGNWSDISNIVRWDWSLDADAPSAQQGLTAKRTGGTVHLSWTANTESDLAGYNVYRATSAGGPFTRINPSLVTGPIYDDSSLPASDLLWYAVTALDQGGNESAKSAAVSVSGTDKFGITLLPPYPNPSAVGGPVDIPMFVTSAPSGARLDILDSGGRRVRRFDLGSLPAGNQEVVWDGKNDASLQTVPGVYSAVLGGHGLTGIVRLVRSP